MEMLAVIYAMAAAIAIGLYLWMKYTKSGRRWASGNYIYMKVTI